MTEVDDVKQLSRLTKLIRERRGRQENPDKTVAIFSKSSLTPSRNGNRPT